MPQGTLGRTGRAREQVEQQVFLAGMETAWYRSIITRWKNSIIFFIAHLEVIVYQTTVLVRDLYRPVVKLP